MPLNVAIIMVKEGMMFIYVEYRVVRSGMEVISLQLHTIPICTFYHIQEESWFN